MALKTPEQGCPGDHSQHDKEKMVRKRFQDNYKTVSECLNYEELVPLLCEVSILLNYEEGIPLMDSSLPRKKKIHLLAEKLDGKSYTELLDCLQREEEHLGHVYVCDILEGRQHASESEIAYSKAVENGVRKKTTHFTKGLNLDELAPHLVQHKLLTIEEREQLSKLSRKSQNLSLLSIISTKGPLGYSLFAKCLQDEDSHVTHGQLYHLIHKDMDRSLLPEDSSKCRESSGQPVTTVCRRVPCRLTLHGELEGREYDRMIYTFQTFQYDGEWDKMEAEASKYLREGVPSELQIAAMLEKAMGLIFRDRKREEPYHLISEAKEKCKLVQGDNSTFLQGRCEYILAILYKYIKQYGKAKEHAENALRILFTVERGHDTAFASLNYASLLMMESDESKKREAKNYLRTAISDATNQASGINLVVPHSYMRMAQMLIGSVHSTKAGIHDQERVRNIREAEECLRSIEPDSLSNRSRCRFYLVESNLYYCKDMRSESEQAAKCGLDLAKRYSSTKEMAEDKSSCSKIIDFFDFYCFSDNP